MANISTESIEGFEGMTPEEKVAALLKLDIPEEVDLSGYVKKSVFDAKAAEASDLSKKLKGKLTEDEQRKAAEEEAKQQEAQKFKDLEDKYNELVKSSTLKEHTISLNGLGFDDKLAADTAVAIVDGDAAKLFKNMKTFLEGFRKSVEKELMDKNPGVNGNGGQSKEEADKAVEFAKGLLGSKKETGTGYSDVMKQYSRGR